VVRHVDEDYEYIYAVVARSYNDAKQYGMSLLDCEYTEVRAKKKKVDVNHLSYGEIIDYFGALSRGLYGWIEEDCPNCKSESNRVYWDNKFFCSNCEENT